MKSTRTTAVDLHEHTAGQITVFAVLALASMCALYVFVAAPALESFFASFLRMDAVQDGSKVVYALGESRSDTVSTGFTTWGLVDDEVVAKQSIITANPEDVTFQATYVFRPFQALLPLVVVGGIVLAAIITVVFPTGFVRQKIEREILTTLDRIAVTRYGEHTNEEIRRLRKDISTADLRKLHDLADTYGMPYSDLELLQGALRWGESNGFQRVMRTHDAMKFYMREYFTDRYSNTILGLVYIGAAVLIIVIGIRGLKFLPATDPSIVLGALGLEFMLLVTYAVVLMYGRSDEQQRTTSERVSQSDTGVDAETEQLLRAFLAVPRREDAA